MPRRSVCRACGRSDRAGTPECLDLFPLVAELHEHQLGVLTELGEEKYLYQGRYFFKFFNDAEVSKLLSATGWQAARRETMTWMESAHPGFRTAAHQHCSRVYLLTAMPEQPTPASGAEVAF